MSKPARRASARTTHGLPNGHTRSSHQSHTSRTVSQISMSNSRPSSSAFCFLSTSTCVGGCVDDDASVSSNWGTSQACLCTSIDRPTKPSDQAMRRPTQPSQGSINHACTNNTHTHAGLTPIVIFIEGLNVLRAYCSMSDDLPTSVSPVMMYFSTVRGMFPPCVSFGRAADWMVVMTMMMMRRQHEEIWAGGCSGR